MGTEYQRADPLPPEDRARVGELLRRYLDERPLWAISESVPPLFGCGKPRSLPYRGSFSGNHWQEPSSTNWLFATIAARE
jgi:hypothetical protein